MWQGLYEWIEQRVSAQENNYDSPTDSSKWRAY